MAKAAKKKQEGKIIRLSKVLISQLESLKERKESYDAFLRRQFGLPTKSGHEQALRTYYVLDTPTELVIRRDLREARGEAILLAVKRGQKRTDRQKKDGVITVRELP